MKVLIIGLGSIGRKHLNALRIIDGSIEVSALRSSKTYEEINGVTSVSTLDEIDLSTFDFAIISNPTYLHAETITKLIPSKIPLFIEKPIFNTIDHVSLIDELKNASIKTYIACNLRFLECIQYMKSKLSTYRINEVTIYCGSYLPDWRPNENYKESYSSRTELGGGVDLDLIHEIDYAYWLFGSPKHVNRFTSSLSSINIESNDYAHYFMTYPTFNMTVTLNYYRREPKRILEVVCEEGTFVVDLINNTVDFKNERLISFPATIQDTYITQLSFFMDKIVKGNELFNDAQEAFKILKICQQND